jgi:hypothetical protein
MQTTTLAVEQASPVLDGAQPGSNQLQNGRKDAVPREGGPDLNSDPGTLPQPSTCNLQPGTSPPDSFSPASNESPRAFEAFTVYFQLPGKRRLTTVARKTGAGLRTVYRWARDFDWAGRVNRHQAGLLQQRAQLETTLAREEIIAWSERALAIREREWEITDDLLEGLQRRLRADNVDAPSLAILARTFALTSRIGRLATGLNARTEEDREGADRREQEFEAALQTAYGHRAPSPSDPPVTTG